MPISGAPGGAGDRGVGGKGSRRSERRRRRGFSKAERPDGRRTVGANDDGRADASARTSTESKRQDNDAARDENWSSNNDNENETDASTARFPIFLFSHGMASSRTDYTHYLGSLAGRGHVVAAVEHRDGSAPASVVMSSDAAGRTVLAMTAAQLA